MTAPAIERADSAADAFEAQLRRDAEAQRRRQLQRARLLLWIGRVVLMTAILLFWELASGPILNTRYVSKPSEIIVLLNRWFTSGEIYPHLLTTLGEVVAGYTLGVILGLSAAILLTFFPRASDVLKPYIVAFYGIPKIAVAPILIMWLGLDVTPRIVIATIIVFFVMFMNSAAGLANVHDELIQIARVMGGSRLQILRKIMLPSASPYILTAMRLTIPDAVVGAIIGEFIAGSLGLGALIKRSSSQMVTPGVFGGIIILATMVIVMRALLAPVERRLLGWRQES